MPQFDFFSFLTEIFWILLGFFSLYLVKIAQTLKLRRILKIKKLQKKCRFKKVKFL
jgi:hypothetical protein